MALTPVPSVRLVVAEDTGRVLLLQRRPGSYGGNGWCLPGGKVDYGRTVEQTIAAELAEETGLTMVSSEFLCLQDRLPAAPGETHCLNLYFVVEAMGAVRINAESIASAWVGPVELAAYDVVFGNREVLERYWAAGGAAPR